MKMINLSKPGNKVAGLISAVAILSIIGISACKKDSTTASATVTEADAVELTTDAITPSTAGFDAQMQTSTSIYVVASLKMSCGQKKDTTLSFSSPASITPNYAYNLAWHYQLDCNGVVPSDFAFTFSGNSSYNGAAMQSADVSTASLTLTGLTASSANYTLNASYERSGKQTSSVGTQKTFNSDLKFTSTNIAVSKTTNEIVSGSATITITGTSSSGSAFSFNGTVTFLGNKKATLVLNSGTTYNIQWN